MAMVHDAGMSQRFPLALIVDSPELPAVLKELHKKRKKTWLYAYDLFFRASDKKKRAANKALALEIARRAKRLRDHILSLQALMVVGAWDEVFEAELAS
jgi:hypothetical protein